ncbi:MAG TPA: cyanophycin synthetase, partial [Bacteroidota bacterium]|nr:cyanophycin synthetase [Bacteroidota bacterium]
VDMPVPGPHNASNGLAAAAVGLAFGVSRASLRRALGRFRAVGRRMEVLRAGGVTILNDTYNANPESVVSALETLSLFSGRGKRVVVLADMLELGKNSAREHERIGRAIARFGFTDVLTYGRLAGWYRRGAKRGRHFTDKKRLSRELRKIVSRGDVVLVKGSRGMKMEEVAGALAGHLGSAA